MEVFGMLLKPYTEYLLQKTLNPYSRSCSEEIPVSSNLNISNWGETNDFSFGPPPLYQFHTPHMRLVLQRILESPRFARHFILELGNGGTRR